jgi:hypothetical protein
VPEEVLVPEKVLVSAKFWYQKSSDVSKITWRGHLCRWNLLPFHEAVDLLLWNRSLSEYELGVFILVIPPPLSYSDDGFYLVGLDILLEVPTLELVLILLLSVPTVNGPIYRS